MKKTKGPLIVSCCRLISSFFVCLLQLLNEDILSFFSNFQLKTCCITYCYASSTWVCFAFVARKSDATNAWLIPPPPAPMRTMDMRTLMMKTRTHCWLYSRGGGSDTFAWPWSMSRLIISSIGLSNIRLSREYRYCSVSTKKNNDEIKTIHNLLNVWTLGI